MTEPKLYEKIFQGEATFVIGAVKIEDVPPVALSEFAFVGRSNVGKSSLINALTNRNSLARISQNPGCTRQINFFNIATKLHLVDLPGYGYAKVNKQQKNSWQKLINDYLRGRQQLKRAFILIDSRHEIKEADIKTMKYLDDMATNYQLLLTKCDKISGKEMEEKKQAAESLASKHPACHPAVLLTSSETKLGIDELREEIYNML